MIKICKVENLKGNEILAKQVITSTYQILMESGDSISKKNIERLKEFGIEEVYVNEEDISLEEKVTLIKADTANELKQRVKSILEKHTFGYNETLKELVHTAEYIIERVLDNKHLLEQVFDIKEHQSDLYSHSISTCALSILTALKLDISKEKVQDIAIGALLHDVGLRYIPISFMGKEIAEYTDEQINLYKKHPSEGYAALVEENWLSEDAKEIILYHHERIDGSGFPGKTKEFSMEVQIVQACDSFDELISGHACRKVKVYEAVEYLKIYKKQKFNEKIVDTILQFTAVYPVGTLVYTNEGEVGVVVRQNRQFPDRPVLKILKDRNGNVKDGNFVKDLLQENTVFIEQALK